MTGNNLVTHGRINTVKYGHIAQLLTSQEMIKLLILKVRGVAQPGRAPRSGISAQFFIYQQLNTVSRGT